MQHAKQVFEESGMGAIHAVLEYISYNQGAPRSPRLFTVLGEVVGPTHEEEIMTWAEQLKQEGRAEGHAKGSAEAALKTIRDNIRQLIELRVDVVPDDLGDRLLDKTLDELNAIFRRAATATRIDEIWG